MPHRLTSQNAGRAAERSGVSGSAGWGDAEDVGRGISRFADDDVRGGRAARCGLRADPRVAILDTWHLDVGARLGTGRDRVGAAVGEEVDPLFTARGVVAPEQERGEERGRKRRHGEEDRRKERAHRRTAIGPAARGRKENSRGRQAPNNLPGAALAPIRREIARRR